MARKPKAVATETAATTHDAVVAKLAPVATFAIFAPVATGATGATVTTKAATPVTLLRPQSKLDRLVSVLRRESGADMPAMLEATGWQAHSIRGALAGALKRRGHIVSSDKSDGRRVWRIHTLVQPTP